MGHQFSGISIILPTLNEEENLSIIIPQLFSMFQDLSIEDYEIIVVDDNSTDNTDVLVNNFAGKGEKVKLIQRKTKNSLPRSILKGINTSSFENVGWLDADGSMPISVLKKLILELIKKPESVIIGSRFVEKGGIKGIERIEDKSITEIIRNLRKSNDSIISTFLSYVLNKVFRFLIKTNVKDITSGFIVGKKSYFDERIFLSANYGDYFIYLLDYLSRNRIESFEIGYICKTRMHGVSKTGSDFISIIKNGIPYLIAVTRCKINRYGN